MVVLVIVLTVVPANVALAIVANNVVNTTFVVVVTAVPRVVTVIVIALVLEDVHPNADLLFVEVIATPVVLVPPIQVRTLKHLFNLL